MMSLKGVRSDGSPTVRKAATAALLALAATAATGCARSVDDRISTIYALGRAPTEPHKNRIAALAGDPDRDVRASALVVMNTVDHARACQIARALMDDPDGEVRAGAVEVLGATADPSLVHELAARAAGDPAWQVRARCLEALVPPDDPAVKAAFEHALDDPVRHVRRVALAAGAEHPDLLGAQALASLLVDEPDWENRVAAVAALGRTKEPEAYDALDVAVHDGNEFVRAAAARGLAELARNGVAREAAAPPERPKRTAGV